MTAIGAWFGLTCFGVTRGLYGTKGSSFLGSSTFTISGRGGLGGAGGDEDYVKDQVPCWLTYTNVESHEIIQNNLHRAPMFSGIVKGVGPRYCPSIEDKIVRFADKERHQLFLEPEGRDTEEVYVQGLSTSLPEDVQKDLVHSIKGLENAEMMRTGYAIEYDMIMPHQLRATLETKKISGLFTAGQTNGTSGYEEAAGQGIIAGINAALKIQGKPELILKRGNRIMHTHY